MKLILTTVMFIMSLIGLGFCVHDHNWQMFLLSMPFTIQFGVFVYLAHRRYVKFKRQFSKAKLEIGRLLKENKKLRQALSSAGELK